MLSPSIYNISKENPPPGNSLEGGRSQHVPEPASSGIVVPEGVDDPAQGPWRGPHATPSALNTSKRLEGNLVSSRPARGCAIQAPVCFLILLPSDLIKRSITRLWWTDKQRGLYGLLFSELQKEPWCSTSYTRLGSIKEIQHILIKYSWPSTMLPESLAESWATSRFRFWGGFHCESERDSW